MTLLEIEKKIIEYRKRLDEKILVRTRKGFKKRPISSHLRSHISFELSKLDKIKKQLESQQNSIVSITWKNIMFDNGSIIISFGNSIHQSYPLINSRKSFELLKPYFTKFSIPNIKATIHNGVIHSITNHEEVLNFLNLLSIQEEFSKSLFPGEMDFYRINCNYKKIKNSDISQLYKLKEKSEYLKILCELQSENFKIIPISEFSVSNLKGEIISDSFLFTIKHKGYLFLIWESIEIKKATYIFRTNQKKYIELTQSVFHYITSEEEAKRLRLRKSIKDKDGKLGVYFFIEHTSLSKWTSNLNEKLGV